MLENNWHLQRNCSKFFPNQPRVSYHWTPEYRTANGTSFFLDEVECDECPRSLISAESKYFMETRHRLKKASELGIQSLPPGTISARTVDALIVIQNEDAAYEYAYNKASQLEQPNSGRNFED